MPAELTGASSVHNISGGIHPIPLPSIQPHYDPLPTRRLLIRRGVWLYIVARLLVLLQLAYAGDSLILPVVSSLWLATAVGALALADLRRRHETSLFDSLGVRARDVFLTGLVPSLVGEALIWLASRLR